MNTTEATFLQHLYTSSRAQRGYFTIRKSAQLDNKPKLVDELERNGLYQLPDQLPYRPDDKSDEAEFEKELKKYPVQFHIYRLKDGTRVFCRSVYRGRDNHSRERYGNYFAHSLNLAKGDEDQILPCAVYNTCDWKYRLRNEDDEIGNPELNPQINELHLSLDANPAAWLSQFDFLFSENRLGQKRLQRFAKIIDWMLDDEQQKHKIVIADEPQYLPYWVFALTLAFPPRLYKHLNFNSFSAQPGMANAYIVCTIPDLPDLSDHTSDYRLVRVDRALEHSSQHHLFTQALVYLIEKPKSDKVSQSEMEKEWIHFFGQLKNEKRIGRNLDEAIEFYNDTKDWLNFSVEDVIKIRKKYPNRIDEFMGEVMRRAGVGPRKAIILNEIETGNFRYLAKIDEFLNKHRGEPQDLGEINAYAQKMLRTKTYVYDELKNYFLDFHNKLLPNTNRLLQEKALDLILKYGNLHQYNIDQVSVFQKIDENTFNSLIEEKYNEIYPVFEKINRFRNTRESAELLQLLNELLKHWREVSSQDEPRSNFWRDITEATPTNVLNIQIWFETCCYTSQLLDEILRNVPKDFHTQPYPLKEKLQIPPALYFDVWRIYSNRNFDDENINEAFRKLEHKNQRVMLEVLGNSEIVEQVLRKVIYDYKNMGFDESFFEEKFCIFFQRYAVLKFSRDFFVNDLLHTLDNLGDGSKQHEQRARTIYKILKENSQNNFAWLPESKDVSMFYFHLKKNGKDFYSEYALTEILQKYDQHYNLEKSIAKVREEEYKQKQQAISNILFVDREKRAVQFQQDLQKMKEGGGEDSIQQTLEDTIDTTFNYEDWIMNIRILKAEYPDEVIKRNIFTFLNDRHDTNPPSAWLLTHLLIALFIEDNQDYLRFFKSMKLTDELFRGSNNERFIYTSIVEKTAKIVGGIMSKKVRDYFLEDEPKSKKSSWFFKN